jgi:predicted lipase
MPNLQETEIDTELILRCARMSKFSYDTSVSYEDYLTEFYQNGSTQAYVLSKEDEIYFVFRGTDSEEDVDFDLEVIKVPFYLGSEETKIGKVHKGFFKYYENVRREMLQSLKKFVEKSPQGKIFCTGHSLGASILLLALDISSKYPDLHLQVYTFGGPRIGDCQFKNSVLNRFPKLQFTRIVNCLDAVPHLPPWIFGYKHLGKNLIVGQSHSKITALKKARFTFLRHFKALKIVIKTFTSKGNVGPQKYHSISTYIECLEK